MSNLDRWAFETGTLRGVAPQFVPSNDSAAGGQRAFKMPVGLNLRVSRATGGPKAANLLPPKSPSLLEQLFPTLASPQKSPVTTQVQKT